MTKVFGNWTEYDNWLKTIWKIYAIHKVEEREDGIHIEYVELDRGIE